MKKYIAYLLLSNVRTKVEFETSLPPVEYLWQRYGMSTYIESLQETEEPEKAKEEKKV